LVWSLNLSQGAPSQTLAWQTNISSLAPGESRAVTLETTVDFTSQGTPGRFTLPPQSVFAEQVLSLDPAAQTVRPGEAALFTVTLANPAALAVTYDLAVSGVAQSWVDIVPQVAIPAGGSVDVPLTLASDPFAPLADYGFVITATTGGVASSVAGTLTLLGDPLLPTADPEAHGVVVSLSPASATAGQGTPASYVARVTNTGSATDTFDLSASGLPAGFTATFEQNSVEVPPGAGNFRDVPLVIVPPQGATPGDYVFTVKADSTTETGVSDDAAGVVSVLASGVDVNLLQASGPPNSTFQMKITNTGQATETFALSLAGPAALAATLATTSVTLAPGQVQTVEIQVGDIEFAFPGDLLLVGVAQSQAHAAVLDSDTAAVQVAGALGLAAAFEEPLVVLPGPGAAMFLLLVENLGNLEDVYAATIMTASGPLSASLVGLDGRPAQSVPLFILPGLSTGALLLQAGLADFGEGTVTVQVRSLTDETIVSQATARVLATAPATDPTLTLDPVAMIVEGGAATLSGSIGDFNAQDALTLHISWGDPLSPNNSQTFSLGAAPLTKAAHGIDWNPATGAFSVAHPYRDDNPTATPQDTYTINATVASGQTGGSDSDSQTVLVKNAAPVITSLHTGGAPRGKPVTLTGAFTDLGALDTHTAVAAWGDGTTSPLTINPQTRTFSAQHVYASIGVFTVTVTLTDEDGAQATATDAGCAGGQSGHVLSICGTPQADRIFIFNFPLFHKVLVKVNGEIWGPYFGVERVLAFGDDGNDVITAAPHPHMPVIEAHGDDGNDRLYGGPNHDRLFGGRGRDYLEDTLGDDFLEGGEGNDTLNGGKGDDVLWGGEGDDRLKGESGDDLLRGGAGRDYLLGSQGDDILLGEEDGDRLLGFAGHNLLIGGGGRDTVHAGAEAGLLIGGTTSHDANDQALRAILAEWSYRPRLLSGRVQNLTSGNGPAPRRNGNTYLMQGITVHPDGWRDFLIGGALGDWYFQSPEREVLVDLGASEDHVTG
jgi:Ca2+-binding RTX toxin-like protein